MPRVRSCPTYLMWSRALRAYLLYVLTCLMCLRAFVFFRCLMCPYFFTCLTCLHYFACLYFLRTYIFLMYMLIKLTQINKHLSTFIKYFQFCNTHVLFWMNFSFLKRKILIIFNAKANTWLFKKLDNYLKREM